MGWSNFNLSIRPVLAPSCSFLGLSGAARRLVRPSWPQIEQIDLKIVLAVACAVLALAFPNLWNLVEVIWGAVWTCQGWSQSTAFMRSLIKEFDWRFFYFFLVLTMKFLSFSDSFFIVNKIAEMQFFDHSEPVIIQMADILARLESWRDSPANEHDKRILSVGKFGENWPAMWSLTFSAFIWWHCNGRNTFIVFYD